MVKAIVRAVNTMDAHLWQQHPAKGARDTRSINHHTMQIQTPSQEKQTYGAETKANISQKKKDQKDQNATRKRHKKKDIRKRHQKKT